MENVSMNKTVHSKEIDHTDGDMTPQSYRNTSHSNVSDEEIPKRKTSFATLPNTTTWQQQSANYQPLEIDGNYFEF